MTSPHSSTAVLTEVLYGTDTYQVRLSQLMPGACLPEAPQAAFSKADLIVVNGTLQVNSHAQKSKTLHKGQRLTLSNQQSISLSNPGEQPALVLEIRWANDLTPVPLAEITEERPWGSFTVLKDEPDYKLKQLAVKPGNRLSLQRHQKREEHWFVTAGQPAVTLEDRIIQLSPGEYIHIPLHHWHRITNPAENSVPVEIIELQLGDYFGEDDIERRQDDYGRR
ncbi:phosphomannose isomerase type II C-terminal cupin domain [Vampirovibrio chlorellavorus]|uniref:phosphomannose isomerase type II C-terminal cupin domain n=1 Tax=Vampirovibrio chlorellavorus TaxID=758823 RepID=UPI0026EFFC8E|nr:phosphomannose isomerase type II C-terminal cupin domain [Vampirovibrio chlorellavorus]